MCRRDPARTNVTHTRFCARNPVRRDSRVCCSVTRSAGTYTRADRFHIRSCKFAVIFQDIQQLVSAKPLEEPSDRTRLANPKRGQWPYLIVAIRGSVNVDILTTRTITGAIQSETVNAVR